MDRFSSFLFGIALCALQDTRSEATKVSPQDVRKKLEAFFNAPQKEVLATEDGRYRVTLAYDFADKKQLEDFLVKKMDVAERSARVHGEFEQPAILLHKPLLVGDLFVRVEYTMSDVKEARGVMLELTNSSEPGLLESGIGIHLSRSIDWTLSLKQRSQSERVISESKSVQPGQKTGITLKRENTKLTGYLSSSSCEGKDDSLYRARVRFSSLDEIQVARLEIQGFVDHEWIKTACELPKDANIGPKEVTKSLWNKKNLEQWYLYDKGVEVKEQSIAIDTQSVAVLVHKNSFSVPSSKFEMTILIDKVYSSPQIAFGFQVSGPKLESDGNILVQCCNSTGSGLGVYRWNDGAWSKLYVAKSSRSLAEGEYKLEVSIGSSHAYFRAIDFGEIEAKDLLKEGTSFKLAVRVQHARVRIKELQIK